MGRPVEALASFTKARELEPRSSKAALDSAIALITLHRVAEAEEAAREALKLDWSNQNAKTFLDRLQMAKERVAIKDAPED
jgi:Flp pilus assembly protein TadD